MLALKRTWFLLPLGLVAVAEPILLLQASKKPRGFATVVLGGPDRGRADRVRDGAPARQGAGRPRRSASARPRRARARRRLGAVVAMAVTKIIELVGRTARRRVSRAQRRRTPEHQALRPHERVPSLRPPERSRLPDSTPAQADPVAPARVGPAPPASDRRRSRDRSYDCGCSGGPSASRSGIRWKSAPQRLERRRRVQRRRRVVQRVQPHRARPDDPHLLAAVQPRDPGAVGPQQLGREVARACRSRSARSARPGCAGSPGTPRSRWDAGRGCRGAGTSRCSR